MGRPLHPRKAGRVALTSPPCPRFETLSHIGSPDDMIASLRADALLPRATDLILQVHPVDPPHDKTLRSLELIATEVAPALGWRPAKEARHAANRERPGPA